MRVTDTPNPRKINPKPNSPMAKLDRIDPPSLVRESCPGRREAPGRPQVMARSGARPANGDNNEGSRIWRLFPVVRKMQSNRLRDKPWRASGDWTSAVPAEKMIE